MDADRHKTVRENSKWRARSAMERCAGIETRLSVVLHVDFGSGSLSPRISSVQITHKTCVCGSSQRYKTEIRTGQRGMQRNFKHPHPNPLCGNATFPTTFRHPATWSVNIKHPHPGCNAFLGA